LALPFAESNAEAIESYRSAEEKFLPRFARTGGPRLAWMRACASDLPQNGAISAEDGSV
jgi:hypothetical protein